jgi:hypothetical protein
VVFLALLLLEELLNDDSIARLLDELVEGHSVLFM